MNAMEEFIEALKIGETLKSLEAEHKWEAEEEKVVEALTQYLQDTVGEYSNNRVHVEFKG